MKIRLKSKDNKSLPRCLDTYTRYCKFLDINKIYMVFSFSQESFMLVDERGEVDLFLSLYFDVIDNSIDEDWIISFDTCDWSVIPNYLRPRELDKCYCLDLYYEESKSIDIFLHYAVKNNISLVANLAYAPRFKQEYYRELLERIDGVEEI